MNRRSPGVVPVALAGLVGAALLTLPAPAGAKSGTPGLVIEVTPSQGLKDDQTVTISGRGLPKSSGSSARTWFVTECTAIVHGRMNPATDTPHCDISDAQALKVSSNGTFTSRYRLTSGIIGDGYCGTVGHATCVIGVGTAQGMGTVVRITFKVPPTSSSAGTGTGASSTTTTTAAG